MEVWWQWQWQRQSNGMVVATMAKLKTSKYGVQSTRALPSYRVTGEVNDRIIS
jgi:hypothetical protein